VQECRTNNSASVLNSWNIQDLSSWAIDIDNPTFNVAMSGPNRDRWMEAFQNELNSLCELDVYELVERELHRQGKNLVERPNDQRVIKGKVVCKVKRGADGSIERYMIRYVGCGYNQTEGVDYFQHHVWAPTGQHATPRVLLVHAATTCCMIRHIDISTAFLHGELSDDETVYVEQPPIINDGTDRVWRLYGLKQSCRKWYEKLVSLLSVMHKHF
jgi:hypothetical protein